MKERKFTCLYQDGKFASPGVRMAIAEAFKEFEGKTTTLILREQGESLTNPQRRFYRGAVLPHVRRVMYDAGDARTMETWHESLLESFAPHKEVKLMNGEIVMRPRRSGSGDEDMTKPQMIAFLTAIMAECAMRGDPVPTRGYEGWQQ